MSDDHLRGLQTWMQGLLLSGRAIAPADAAKQIRGTHRLPPHRRLQIYQRSYVMRLRECMSRQFPVLRHALGPELFRGFVDDYLHTRPPEHWSLDELGSGLAAHLSATRPDAHAEVKEDWPDFIIELARFEMAIVALFRFRAEVPDDQQVEATDRTPDDALHMRAVHRLFAHRFPICAYYRAVSAEEQPELPFEQASFCLIVRRDFRLHLYPLTRAQHALLHGIERLGGVPPALADLAARPGVDAEALRRTWPTWRAGWLKAGLFVTD